MDDTVSGVVAALDYIPKECGEQFNLGLGQPVNVPDLVHILEKELGIPAKVVNPLTNMLIMYHMYYI